MGREDGLRERIEREVQVLVHLVADTEGEPVGGTIGSGDAIMTVAMSRDPLDEWSRPDCRGSLTVSVAGRSLE